EVAGHLLSRAASRPRTARGHGAPVRRADHRPCRVRPCRRLSRDLLGRQEPDGQREPHGDDGNPVVRLAYRHHGGGEPALRLDLARGDDTGDTFWTNLAAAYTGLSQTMRGFVDGLRGIHRYVPRENPKPGSEYNERIKRRALASEHPLVTVHAETGERV